MQTKIRFTRPYPVGSDNYGWYLHYANLFNKTQRETAAHLAMWHLMCHLRDHPEENQ